MPNYATSPSYPPNNPTATVVPNYHPALQALYLQHPNFANLLKGTEFGGNGTTQAVAHGMFNRPFAVAGNPNGNSQGAETEFRKYDVVRFAFDFEGSLTNDIDYTTGLNYSQSEGDYTFSDTQQNKYNAALWCYGLCRRSNPMHPAGVHSVVANWRGNGVCVNPALGSAVTPRRGSM